MGRGFTRIHAVKVVHRAFAESAVVATALSPSDQPVTQGTFGPAMALPGAATGVSAPTLSMIIQPSNRTPLTLQLFYQ